MKEEFDLGAEGEELAAEMEGKEAAAAEARDALSAELSDGADEAQKERSDVKGTTRGIEQ